MFTQCCMLHVPVMESEIKFLNEKFLLTKLIAVNSKCIYKNIYKLCVHCGLSVRIAQNLIFMKTGGRVKHGSRKNPINDVMGEIHRFIFPFAVRYSSLCSARPYTLKSLIFILGDFIVFE